MLTSIAPVFASIITRERAGIVVFPDRDDTVPVEVAQAQADSSTTKTYSASSGAPPFFAFLRAMCLVLTLCIILLLDVLYPHYDDHRYLAAHALTRSAFIKCALYRGDLIRLGI
jgi:hypothetical protein